MIGAGPGAFVILAGREDGLPLTCQVAVQIPCDPRLLKGQVSGAPCTRQDVVLLACDNKPGMQRP